MVASQPAFDRAFAIMPLIAILRGIQASEVLSVADALVNAGIKLIEVPLSSNEAFTSIELLVKHCADDVVVGAGTVLDITAVHRLSEIGAKLMVTPNVDSAVINAGNAVGLVTITGCMTPSEVLLAVRHGAAAIKIFPASKLGPAYARDIKAVLPRGTRLLAVGGVGKDEIEPYHAGGYDGFGFGSNLYVPGHNAEQVAATANQLCNEWSQLRGA
jgi:2-dehydro-3-deoxyphosphogalactonate aldolase